MYASTPMHLAARSNQAGIVGLLAGAGAPVDPPNEGGRTPLHLAAGYGHPETVQALLELDASVNQQDANGETPVHRAAFHQHLECIRVLLERGANPESPDNRGNTPLHVAAMMNRDQSVRLLLEAGARVDIPNAEGLTPLDLTIINFHETPEGALDGKKTPWGWFTEHNSEAAEALLERGGTINTVRIPVGDRHPLWPQLTPAEMVHESGHLYLHKHPDPPDEWLERLTDASYGPADPGLSSHLWRSTLLHDAVFKNIPAVVNALLDAGAFLPTSLKGSADYEGRSPIAPIHVAARTGNLEMASLLLDRGADLESPAYYRMPKDSICIGGDRGPWGDPRDFLLDRQSGWLPRHSPGGRTPFDTAVAYGQVEMARFLLERGAAPFPAIPGKYQGLFYDPKPAREQVYPPVVEVRNPQRQCPQRLLPRMRALHLEYGLYFPGP